MKHGLKSERVFPRGIRLRRLFHQIHNKQELCQDCQMELKPWTFHRLSPRHEVAWVHDFYFLRDTEDEQPSEMAIGIVGGANIPMTRRYAFTSPVSAKNKKLNKVQVRGDSGTY